MDVFGRGHNLGDMIDDVLQHELDRLREMQALGVVLADGVDMAFPILVTTEASVADAASFELEEDEESDDEESEDDGQSYSWTPGNAAATVAARVAFAAPKAQGRLGRMSKPKWPDKCPGRNGARQMCTPKG